VSQQGPDGAIRSRTYAYFKDGYSLTPLALAALFAVPAPDEAAYARGVDFIAGMADAKEMTYPLYSMAIGTLVLNVSKNLRHDKIRQSLILEVRKRQLDEKLGWDQNLKSYGGWGYYDGIPQRGAAPDEELAANLSSTLYAIGALVLAGTPLDDPALGKARAFVERCQNPDGGFFFSPDVPDANKAGPFRSYGSMTADGVRALIRLGTPVTDPKVVAAAAWLEKHFEADRNPGDFPPVNEVRRASSYYYWSWSAAHALRDLGATTLHTERGDVRWAEALAETLLARQRGDGSWANPASEMREDDPIVATSFATAALGVCRQALGGPYRSHAAQR
jgi:squalene-hopene/tetraprenyl-beta-curcumene cyclase